ncbi:MAG: flagellar basal body P-ring protein FlgI [Sedimentisphaerales bacterium]
MKNRSIYTSYIVLAVTILICSSVCYPAAKQKKSKKAAPAKVEQPLQLDKTIGDFAEVVAFSPIPVKGIGLVVGLANTGSAECPPDVRAYLRQYITSRVGDRKLINPDKMIDSLDTAVVLVEGFIPAGATKQQAFDVKVSTLANTQTTSLKGGRLYTTELKYVSQIQDVIGASKTLAYAAGGVYIDNISEPKPDPRGGFVLGGGKVIKNSQILLSIFKPDFRTAALIRNRINERFGKNVAEAPSESIIALSPPEKYNDDKAAFLELLKSIYLSSSQASEETYITSLVEKLKAESEKTKYEIRLEAVGKSAIPKIIPLLDSNDLQTKFVAARCLLKIGDYRGLKILRNIAQDSSSSLRLDAINAIGKTAGKEDVISLMNRLVADASLDVRYAAYKYLKKYNDDSIIQTLVGGNFYIDQAIQLSPKTVWISRNGEPRIVMLGAPLDCRGDIFVESDDGHIIINSLPDENKISIMRKHPVTGELMGPLKTSFRLADVIRTLGDEPAPEDDKKRVGLGVSYTEIVELLKKMCENGAVDAVFAASAPPETKP